MNRTKKNKKPTTLAITITITIILSLLPSTPTPAASTPKVVETYTGESEIALYIKGIQGDDLTATIQAGTTPCGTATATRLSETTHPVQTLLLLDHSQSIPKADRKRIQKILQTIIAGRMPQEQMAIAVFDEGVTYLADYTLDSQTLQQTAANISYQRSNTYLTDVLYDLLASEYTMQAEDIFRRILVISDGVDNKSIGYTKDELYALLKEYPIPVYTVGIQTGKKSSRSNNSQLKNMFALSRITGADSFLLDGPDSQEAIAQSLKQDQDIVRLPINLPDSLLDGSKKACKVTFASGETVSTQAIMPQQAKAPEETGQIPDAATGNTAQGAKQDTKAHEKASKAAKPGIILAAVCLAAAALLLAIILLIKKKQRKTTGYHPTPTYGTAPFHGMPQTSTMPQANHTPSADEIQTVYEAASNNQKPPANATAASPMPSENGLASVCSGYGEIDDGKTEMIGAAGTGASSGDETVMMWNTGEAPSCQICLTDTKNPARFFQAPLNNGVIIGRRQGACHIVLDYDRSVSGRHCEVKAYGGKAYILDLQSSNGTFVDGHRVLEETEIKTGTILTLGNLSFQVEILQ